MRRLMAERQSKTNQLAVIVSLCAALSTLAPALSAEPQQNTPSAKPVVGEKVVDFEPYMTRIEAKIKKHWQAPSGDKPLSTKVLFKIRSNGDIFATKIENSSGVACIDKAALEALIASSPLDPLPAGSPSFVDIDYVFDANMSGQEPPKRPVPKELVTYQVTKARMSLKQDRPSEALSQLFVVSSSTDPQIAIALEAIARRAQTLDFKTGTQIILQTINMAPQDQNLHKSLAMAFEKGGKDFKSAEAHMELAKVLDREGDIESALVEYQEAYRISGDPKYGDSLVQTNSKKQGDTIFDTWQSLVMAGANTANHVARGYAYEMCRKYDSAEQEYRKALESDPQSEIAKARLAALPGTPKRVSIRRQAHSESHSTTPSKYPQNRLSRLNNEAVLLMKSNQYGAAIQKLEMLLYLDPTYSFARDNIGITYNNYALTRPPKEAIRFFHRALFIDPNNKTTKENLQEVVRALGLNPTDAQSRLKLATEAEQAKDYKTAVVEYRAALELKQDPIVQAKLKASLLKADAMLMGFPDKLALTIEENEKLSGASNSTKQQASKLNNDGVKLLDKEQFTAAIKTFEEAVTLDPTNEYAKVNLGIAYNNYALKAQPKEAVKLFHTGLFKEPYSKAMEKNLQTVLRRLGMKPDQAAIRVKLAEAAEQEKDYKAAVVEYRAALALKANPKIEAKMNAALELAEAKPKRK